MIPITTKVSVVSTIDVDEKIYFFGLDSNMIDIKTTNGGTKRTTPSSTTEDNFNTFEPLINTGLLVAAGAGNTFAFLKSGSNDMKLGKKLDKVSFVTDIGTIDGSQAANKLYDNEPASGLILCT